MSDRQVVVPKEIQEYYDKLNYKIVVLDNHGSHAEVTVFSLENTHRTDTWHWNKFARGFFMHYTGAWER